MALFNKLLIANRGEIACRIIRTAKKLGIQTVAIFSEADSHALHVKLADEAYFVGPAASKESYLNIKKIIGIAKEHQVDAIHPGYGFLSENSDFAKACEIENITFVGPSSTAIELMASKSVAKQKMQEHGVPILPGCYDPSQNVDNLLRIAEQITFPIVLKAVAGGGGKGLRLVKSPEEFEQAFLAVKREAKAFFNDDKVLLEKYLSNARHVEVQILADQYNNTKALFTRDCSIQRRHQKIIEEAPAPNLKQDLNEKIMAAAITAARAINYTNAGTVEFLVENENFYFMEMNTRLQVEHPVTEMITGLDLVEWQLRIAAGEKFTIENTTINGHAIEVRLNAEDPENEFIPSAGGLNYFHLPTDASSVRVDSGYQQGDEINIYYDSLIAKIIAWGETRSVAISRLQQFLNEAKIFGIKTNLSLLKALLLNRNFHQAILNTNFLQQEYLLLSQATHQVVAIAALFVTLLLKHQQQDFLPDPYSPWKENDAWRLYTLPTFQHSFLIHQEKMVAQVQQHDQNFVTILNNQEYYFQQIDLQEIDEDVFELHFVEKDKFQQVTIYKNFSKLEINYQHNNYYIEIIEESSQALSAEHEQPLLAPMPGTIVALLVDSGQKVTKGDKLLVIEAMKMEHTLYAPRNGTIKQCFYKTGDLIKEGAELMEFETD